MENLRAEIAKRQIAIAAAGGHANMAVGVWQNGAWQKALGTDGKWYARELRQRIGSEWMPGNREYWSEWRPVADFELADGVEYPGYREIIKTVVLPKGN